MHRTAWIPLLEAPHDGRARRGVAITRGSPEAGRFPYAPARRRARREITLGDRWMLKEFKAFAMRGNVVDMAVGIIIGGAFGTIVSSLVNDVIMPPIGLALGGVDFRDFFAVLKDGAAGAGSYATVADAKTAGAVTLNYGMFINAVISFTIVAFAVFLLVKGMNSMKASEPAAAPAPNTRECPQCLSAVPRKAVRCAHCTSPLPPAA
jgi:large conductance mechanosensitive channel